MILKWANIYENITIIILEIKIINVIIIIINAEFREYSEPIHIEIKFKINFR